MTLVAVLPLCGKLTSITSPISSGAPLSTSMPVAEILWTSASISAPVAFDPCRGSRILRYDNIEARLTNPSPPVVVNASYPRDTHHRSEEHTSELQSLMRISYAVFFLKKKKHTTQVETR